MWRILLLPAFLVILDARVAISEEPSECEQGQFRCLVSGKCINFDWTCDGDRNCNLGSISDDSDESQEVCADRECTSLQFKCKDNVARGVFPACIEKDWVCDGFNDCVNGSDEMPPNCYLNEQCPEERSYKCQKDICIQASWECDHITDCPDGKDEENCDYRACNADEFKCSYDACIHKSKKCDGKYDCKDGSDEKEVCAATEVTCRANEYQCDNGKCLSEVLLCNNVDDCGDMTDEIYCNQTDIDHCSTVNHGCEICVPTHFSYKCECDRGFRLQSDKKSCEDIDECGEQPGICPQICSNTRGSYLCTCAEGYSKQLDKSCKRKDDVEPVILFGNRYYMRLLSLNGTFFDTVSGIHDYVQVLDYDNKERMVYFIDTAKAQIVRTPMSGGRLEPLYIGSNYVSSAEGIAVDWVGRKLYWSSRNQEGIFVSELNGTSLYAVVPSGTLLPRAIALYPRTGHMYWTDWSMTPFIGKIGMDGSNMQKVVTTELFWPNGLTIDYTTDRLFWIDAHLDRIEFSDLDGKNRHIALYSVPHGYGITVFEDNVYWTEWNLKRIETANKYTGKDQHILKEVPNQPFDIHVIHPTRQPEVVNPCGENNGGCSHLCLLAPGDDGPSYACACPATLQMKSDGKNCLANCTNAQMECGLSDHKCVSLFDECNDIDDCAGGEDEGDFCAPVGCPTNGTYFQCFDRIGCVNVYRLCDGNPDCKDGSDEPDWCSERVCHTYELRCDSGQCLPKQYRCDGQPDCMDDSDELRCDDEPEECDENHFTCTNGRCIPQMHFCNMEDDCGDGSDEPMEYCHANKTCLVGWHKCKYSYRCIPGTSLCDGEDDCKDNSDEMEESCDSCRVGDFRCDNGQCIPMRWKCDFEDDCADSSDESSKLCDAGRRNCSEAEFRCGNGRCISSSLRCDHGEDCNDGSDEENCDSRQCPLGLFKCLDNSCIDSHLKCDGFRDCPDASDELGCPTRYPGGEYCAEEQFTCDNTVCLPRERVCDAIDDCGDGSDETNTTCMQVPCDLSINFRCKNYRCIPLWFVCDRVDDCGDNSDENNSTMCKKKPETPCDSTGDYFHCVITGECIRAEQLCDDKPDCGDQSDEMGCVVKDGEACSNNNGGCEQHCQNLGIAPGSSLPAGYICSCNKTHVVDENDPHSCVDRDECAIILENNCTQKCENSNGQFFCSCNDGFRRYQHDFFYGLCQPLEGKGNLILSNGNELRVFFENEIYTFVAGQRRINAIGIDHENDIVYWTDSSVLTIKRAKIPSNSNQVPLVQNLLIEDMISPKSVAVDWLSGNVYWSEDTDMNIYVCRSDGNFKKRIIWSELTDSVPTSIAVNPLLRRLYWIDSFGQPAIKHSYLNGEDADTLYNDYLLDPVGLAVDYHMDNRIFWTDVSLGHVMSVNNLGGDPVTLIEEMNQPYYLDVFAGNVFWISPSSRKVMRQDIFGRLPNITILENQLSLHDIKVYSNVKSPTGDVENFCAKLNCNALCLPSPNGAECACPDGSDFIKGSTERCNLSDINVKEIKDPSFCLCQNGGSCRLNESEVPTCLCPIGYSGETCEIVVATTGGPITEIDGQQGQNGKASSSLVVIIVIPTILAILIIAIILGIVVYMYKKGTFSKTQGQFRSGAPGGDNARVSVHMDDNNLIIEPMSFDDTTQFANHMYETSQHATNESNGNTNVAHLDANANADELPNKQKIDNESHANTNVAHL